MSSAETIALLRELIRVSVREARVAREVGDEEAFCEAFLRADRAIEQLGELLGADDDRRGLHSVRADRRIS